MVAKITFITFLSAFNTFNIVYLKKFHQLMSDHILASKGIIKKIDFVVLFTL